MPSYSDLLKATLRYLGLRPRSQHEIEQFLARKTTDTQLINQVVAKLISSKLIDDDQFQKWYIESRSRSKPRGARLLELELKAKGITFDPQFSSENDLDLACQALIKKQKLWSRLSPKDQRPKAIRFLQSRGFSWSVIEQALKKGYND